MKMKNKIGIVLIAIFMALNSFAQEKAHAEVSVTNFDNEPLSGAQIEFFNTNKNTIVKGVSNKEGKLEVDLAAGVYNIRLKSVGKSKDYSAIEIPELGEHELYNVVEIFIQYEEDKSFTLSDLHFESGKSVIKSGSFGVLDELADYLKYKEDLKIEIGGHTDNNGSESSNLILSQERADAVKNYLLKKGINADRLKTKGYGESIPIADNGNANGQALNRRTEILILN